MKPFDPLAESVTLFGQVMLAVFFTLILVGILWEVGQVAWDWFIDRWRK